MNGRRIFIFAALLGLCLACGRNGEPAAEEQEEPVPTLYGIDYRNYSLIQGELAQGESMGKVFGRLGLSAKKIDEIDRACKGTFDMRTVRAGNKYTAFLEGDSTARSLTHFVYEKNLTDYVIFTLHGDSVVITEGQKEIRKERLRATATINSSLWNCIIENNLSPALAVEIEDIFAWSVDFFGIQKGDSLTVIYDNNYVDTLSVGVGRVWGAVFTHGGKDYYAIPFKQGDKITYWDEKGNSLRKMLLKAPLKYSRISSRFSNARLHPIYRVYRPHHGVDYAAPAGTPVYAIADGVVTFKGWSGGGGNTLKIKHPRNLMSGYLHLRGYAKGISVGTHVRQGQLIGYVGSTGASTGPHLDFRLWKGGKPIDPLKAPSEPTEPISAENMTAFSFVRQSIMDELAGHADSTRLIVQLDSIPAAIRTLDITENTGK